MKTTTFQKVTIPAGKAGTLKTLKIMRALVRKYKSAPLIRLLSQNVTKKAREKNYTDEARIIHALVRDKIRYLKDINGVETVQTPVQTLKLGAGDCDDKSLLVAAMLESVGHPTRFVAVGFTPYFFTHVFTQTKIGRKWVTVETTEKYPLGKAPPGIKTRLIVRN